MNNLNHNCTICQYMKNVTACHNCDKRFSEVWMNDRGNICFIPNSEFKIYVLCSSCYLKLLNQ